MSLVSCIQDLRKYRNLVLVVFIFCMVATLSFLATSNMDHSSARASTEGFKPGNIMSDAVMSDYNSMTKDEIQAFLSAKGNCSNTNYDLYLQIKAQYPKTEWHFENGKFVCLSEEIFGLGNTFGPSVPEGEGQTAAEIIYEAALDYQINPQVLIVLLEKEQSLITDSYPNSVQYRSATGYGCPDTAACDTKYYGFRNQVRNAAAMFRSVLDGGWSNYPAGKTIYVQYHPSASCGGSQVYIENRATSALYRYTPYQPNASALAAGYGSGDTCSAYGNRNFYLYFTDWFGSTQKDIWVELSTPRYFEATQDISRIDPVTGQSASESIIKRGAILFYSSKSTIGGTQCLRTEHNTIYNIQACVPQEYLKEIELNYQDIPVNEQYKIINAGGAKITANIRVTSEEFHVPLIRRFLKKAEFLDDTYYFTEHDVNLSQQPFNGFKSDALTDIEEYSQISQNLFVNQATAEKVDLKTSQVIAEMGLGAMRRYTAKLKINNRIYYQTEFEWDNNNTGYLVDGSDLVGFEPLATPRRLRLTQTVDRTNPITGEYYDTLNAGAIIEFAERIFVNNQWYYRTKHNATYGLYFAIPETAIEEI